MSDERDPGVRVPDVELASLDLLRRQTSGAAHTLNNIFTSLLGELALLEDERKGDPVVEEATHALREQLDRCVKLVRTGLMQRDVGPRDSLEAEVDLGLLLSRCQRILDGTLPRRIGLHVRVPDESWVVRGEAREIEVMLLALTFRLGDLVPACMDVTISLCAGSASGTLALQFDVAAAELPSDARQRLVDPALEGNTTAMASLAAIHAIADRHGSHLQTERTGEESLRLSLVFERLPG